MISKNPDPENSKLRPFLIFFQGCEDEEIFTEWGEDRVSACANLVKNKGENFFKEGKNISTAMSCVDLFGVNLPMNVYDKIMSTYETTKIIQEAGLYKEASEILELFKKMKETD